MNCLRYLASFLGMPQCLVWTMVICHWT